MVVCAVKEPRKMFKSVVLAVLAALAGSNSALAFVSPVASSFAGSAVTTRVRQTARFLQRTIVHASDLAVAHTCDLAFRVEIMCSFIPIYDEGGRNPQGMVTENDIVVCKLRMWGLREPRPHRSRPGDGYS